MAKEFERAGIPTTIVSTLAPLAQSIGPNRIVAGKAVAHPLGDPALSMAEERAFRRNLVRVSLDLLQTDVNEPTVVGLETSSAIREPTLAGT
jgi:glycine reductase